MVLFMTTGWSRWRLSLASRLMTIDWFYRLISMMALILARTRIRILGGSIKVKFERFGFIRCMATEAIIILHIILFSDYPNLFISRAYWYRWSPVRPHSLTKLMLSLELLSQNTSITFITLFGHSLAFLLTPLTNLTSNTLFHPWVLRSICILSCKTNRLLILLEGPIEFTNHLFRHLWEAF